MVFASVTRWGIAGGALNAALLAVPTMAMGLGLGVALKALGHVKPWVRRVGGIGVGALGTGLIGWIWYVGHLRALAEAALARGEELTLLNGGAWTQMWGDPTRALDSWPAVVLMVLQATGAAVAVWEGYAGFADRYIGYASVDRRYRRALDEVETVRASFVKDISELAESAILAIERRRKEYDRKAKVALEIVTRSRGILARSAERNLDVEWAFTEALREYRDVNMRSRPAATWPARFSEPIRLIGASQTPLDFDPEIVRERVRKGVMAAHAAADAAVVAVKRLRLMFLTAAEGEESAAKAIDRARWMPVSRGPDGESPL
jgi:hypothetical protein